MCMWLCYHSSTVQLSFPPPVACEGYFLQLVSQLKEISQLLLDGLP